MNKMNSYSGISVRQETKIAIKKAIPKSWRYEDFLLWALAKYELEKVGLDKKCK